MAEGPERVGLAHEPTTVADQPVHRLVREVEAGGQVIEVFPFIGVLQLVERHLHYVRLDGPSFGLLMRELEREPHDRPLYADLELGDLLVVDVEVTVAGEDIDGDILLRPEAPADGAHGVVGLLEVIPGTYESVYSPARWAG